MFRKAFVSALAVASVLAAVPALADDAACVRPIRIYSTRVLDDHTLLVTDRQKNQYTVHMNGTCTGMHEGVSDPLGFRRYRSDLSCLQRGDEVSYAIPGAGRASCFIGEVTEGAPAGAPQG
jgi:hypothetical protein